MQPHFLTSQLVSEATRKSSTQEVYTTPYVSIKHPGREEGGSRLRGVIPPPFSLRSLTLERYNIFAPTIGVLPRSPGRKKEINSTRRP